MIGTFLLIAIARKKLNMAISLYFPGIGAMSIASPPDGDSLILSSVFESTFTFLIPT
jgi:hypothetical protein